MTGTPLDLLSLVGTGTRFLGLGRSPQPEQEGANFAKALDAAKEGELSSGRVIVSGPDLEIDLSSEQLQRLAHAADVAEAQGAQTAAVLIDGMVIKVDIESRMAMRSTPVEGALMGDVDLVVAADAATQPAPSSDALLRRLSATSVTPVQQQDQG